MSCASDVIEKLTVITVIAASYHGKIVTSSVGIIGIAPNIIGRIMPAAACSVVRRRTRAACAARTRCTRAPHEPHATCTAQTRSTACLHVPQDGERCERAHARDGDRYAVPVG